MSKYFITKPSRKNPSELRVIRKFESFEDALRWAQRYIYKDDHRLFIDDQTGFRWGSVEYDEHEPIVTLSEKP